MKLLIIMIVFIITDTDDILLNLWFQLFRNWPIVIFSWKNIYNNWHPTAHSHSALRSHDLRRFGKDTCLDLH